MSNQTQQKDLNLFTGIIEQVVQKKIDKIQMSKNMWGTVKNIYENGQISNADVEVGYGSQATLLEKIDNKSGQVLSVGDEVLLVAPSGQLSSIYIDKTKNKIKKINGEQVIGTLVIGGEQNENGAIIVKDWQGNTALTLENEVISFFDYVKSGEKIGSIVSAHINDNTGTATNMASMSLVAEEGKSISICKKVNESLMDTVFEVSNNTYNDGVKTNVHSKFYIDVDNTHALYVQSDADGGNQNYGHQNHNGWDVNNVGNLNCVNLKCSGTKNCVQDTPSYGQRLFYSHEYTESWLSDVYFGKIENGTCTIKYDLIFQECVDLGNEKYVVKFYPEESCNYKLTKNSTSVTVTADKDVDFSVEIMAKRNGFEKLRLQDAEEELGNTSPESAPQGHTN